MPTATRVLGSVLAVMVAAGCLAAPHAAWAASAEEIEQSAKTALENLYNGSPEARILGREAKAILVFPSIVKAGFMFGGQYGNGALFERGRVIGYYNSSAVSYGFQAGVESFSYALFFMNQTALDYLRNTEGWEIGAGPNVVVLDQGMAQSVTSTTMTQDVYAMIFGMQGLMAGIGLQGSKITQMNP